MYIKEPVENTLIIEKSRFIAYLFPVSCENEYKELLKQIKKKHYDASHVCSALICGNIKRSSDDGEPAGTAGVPILSVLEKNNIDNICALVVRYFGGIKLGAGGLIRAYGKVTSDALKKAKFVEDEEYRKYELILDYDMANKMNYLLNKEAVNLEVEYGEKVKYVFLTNDDKLIDRISEITSGILPNCIGKEIIQKEL